MQGKPYKISNRTKEVLIAVSRVLIKEPHDLEIQNRDEAYVERCQAVLREFPALLRRLFALGLYIFDRFGFFFVCSLKRFSHMKSETQEKYITKCVHSRLASIRDFYTGLRGLVMICYFSHPDVSKYIGYDPKGHVEERKQLRKKLLNTIVDNR